MTYHQGCTCWMMLGNPVPRPHNPPYTPNGMQYQNPHPPRKCSYCTSHMHWQNVYAAK